MWFGGKKADQPIGYLIRKQAKVMEMPITLPGTLVSILDKNQYVFMLPSGIII